jgi:hypothetical protein
VPCDIAVMTDKESFPRFLLSHYTLLSSRLLSDISRSSSLESDASISDTYDTFISLVNSVLYLNQPSEKNELISVIFRNSSPC